MSENTTASLKQEILDWAMKLGSPKSFTTHDVYEHIHSAETPSHTSDALRSMWKYDKTLDREEFMDGNKKRFVYSLSKKNSVKVDIEEAKATEPGITVTQHAYKKEGNISINQQIEIPNNFCIELKTPNGFTITIKAGDLIK